MIEPNLQHEIRRKTIHVFMGFLIISTMYQGWVDTFTLFIILVFAVSTSFILKWHCPVLIEKILEKIQRPEEKPGEGFITFLIGVILALELFPQDIAYAAIMILTLGDGLSSVFGMCFGRTKTILSSFKLLEGTIVGIIFSTIAAAYFIPLHEAFIAASIAMVFEAMEIRFSNKIVDDNILVPLVSGSVILLMRMYF